MTETITCHVCPHDCCLAPGQTGLCRARMNQNGSIRCKNYGQVTALALDPVEKKPLFHFYPGSFVLSVGSYGCNLRCAFCQNSDISMDSGRTVVMELMPAQLVEKAEACLPQGCIGIAYTYNEPLVGYEYVKDCAQLAKSRGLKNVVVTNGCIRREPLLALLPWVDAMNIDLKGFSRHFYEMAGGDLETVKDAIALAAAACHVEVTTLIIPGENDSVEEMRRKAEFLADISPKLPLHITRFFPRYHMQDREATPVETLYRLKDEAEKYLRHVHVGNV